MEIFLSVMATIANFLAGPFALYAAEIGLGFCLVGLIFFGRHVLDNLVWVAVGSIGLLGLHTLAAVFIG